jgi:hypothetical protein
MLFRRETLRARVAVLSRGVRFRGLLLVGLAAFFAFVAFGAFVASPAVAQTVRGDVRAADTNRPLPGARLLLIDANDTAVDSTRADRESRFRLTAPAPGEYVVYFHVDGYASVPSEAVRLERGATVELAFRPVLVANAAIRQMSEVLRTSDWLQQSLPEICGEPFRAWEAGLLVGVVRRRADREPIAGARVSLIAEGDDARTAISSESGVYVLCNLPVGPAVPLRVETPDGLLETTDVDIRAGTASWYDLPVGPRRR